MVHSVFDFVLVLAGYATPFAILDAASPAPIKSRVATFVFGYEQAKLTDLERSVFTAIFTIFIKDGELSWLRILVYSIAITFLFPTITLFTYWSFGIHHPFGYIMPWISATPAFLLWSPILFCFDLYSFKVTKFLLWNRSLSFTGFLTRTVFDVLLTMLAIVVVVAIPLMLGIPNPLPRDIFYCILVSMILVNGTQILIILLGTIVRFGFLTLRLNQPIGAYTNFSNHPFLFVGLLFGFIVALISSFS